MTNFEGRGPGDVPAAPEPAERRRRFTLLDAMVLVAATGLALAWDRANQEDIAAWLSRAMVGSFPLRMRLFSRTAPYLTAWTLALLALRFRGQRPRRRRLARSRGFAACAAASLGIAIGAATIAVDWALHALGISMFSHDPFGVALRMIAFAGPSVAGAWLTLALPGGRCRPPGRDWVERCGRAIGIGWLGLFILICINI